MGVSLTWENPTRENIILEVFKKDDGEWISLENFYSSVLNGVAKIRNLAAEPITLGYRIQDRWENYSKMMEKESTPLYEEELSKSLFKEVNPLPGDCEECPVCQYEIYGKVITTWNVSIILRIRQTPAIGRTITLTWDR